MEDLEKPENGSSLSHMEHDSFNPEFQKQRVSYAPEHLPDHIDKNEGIRKNHQLGNGEIEIKTAESIDAQNLLEAVVDTSLASDNIVEDVSRNHNNIEVNHQCKGLEQNSIGDTKPEKHSSFESDSDAQNKDVDLNSTPVDYASIEDIRDCSGPEDVVQPQNFKEKNSEESSIHSQLAACDLELSPHASPCLPSPRSNIHVSSPVPQSFESTSQPGADKTTVQFHPLNSAHPTPGLPSNPNPHPAQSLPSNPNPHPTPSLPSNPIPHPTQSLLSKPNPQPTQSLPSNPNPHLSPSLPSNPNPHPTQSLPSNPNPHLSPRLPSNPNPHLSPSLPSNPNPHPTPSLSSNPNPPPTPSLSSNPNPCTSNTEETNHNDRGPHETTAAVCRADEQLTSADRRSALLKSSSPSSPDQEFFIEDQCNHTLDDANSIDEQRKQKAEGANSVEGHHHQKILTNVNSIEDQCRESLDNVKSVQGQCEKSLDNGDVKEGQSPMNPDVDTKISDGPHKQTLDDLKLTSDGHERGQGGESGLVSMPQGYTPSTAGVSTESQMDDFNSPSTSKSSNGPSQVPCRILTQYVFVNRPQNKKATKKKFGVLYNQAFRHFQRAKIKFPNLFGKMKKGKVKKVKEKVKIGNNDREERWKRRVLMKDSTPAAESVKVKKPQRSESKKNKKLDRKPKKKDRSEKAAWKNSKKAERSGRKMTKSKSKTTKKRLLTDTEKAEVKEALKLPGATVQSVSADFGVAKTILRQFSKETISIGKEETAEKKRKKGKVENHVVVKEETPDPLFWDYHEPLPPNPADGDDDKEDLLNKELEQKSKPNFKLRRELTLEQKVLVIQDLQKSGSKVTHVAKKYGISSSSVSRLNKHKQSILHKVESGDVCRQMKRTRDCKAPELDKALLKWYRTIEGISDHPISMTNILLREKSHNIAAAMGCAYLPTTNWILRWKYRHNIVCKQGRIEFREDLDPLDTKVDMAEILSAVNLQLLNPGHLFRPDGTLIENNIKEEKPEEFFVCEHCGVVVQSRKTKKKKRTIHLKECPLYAHRRDLTLGEKVKVVRALEKPGVKMVQVAKKFCISTSAISRIHKDRIDILARFNEGYINMDRKRSRVSKEPEVERTLCDWYRMQHEMGIHVSSYMVREKAKEIATDMGKDFCPSDSWVFRWRNRNNVNGPIEFEMEDEEEEGDEATELEEAKYDPGEDRKPSIADCDVDDDDKNEGGGRVEGEEFKSKRKRKSVDDDGPEPKKKRFIFPRSVMCEKCGCVSIRLKNNRIRNMRHSKGCPLLKPRNEMTYEDRIKMLRELEEPGATLSSVARKYGVSTSSMSRMNQNKDVIMNQGLDRGNQKRIRDCKEPEVAKQLYAWYLERQAEGIHVTGTKLKEKASRMAKDQGREFKVSTGWLGRWKNRYNILFKQQDGKDKAVKKDGPKRKPSSKKTEKRVLELEEEAQVSSEFAHHMDMTNAVGVSDVAQTIQTPRMFFAQRYHQNPWELAQQASTSCARPKDFITTVSHNIPPEENQGPYGYDPLSSTTRHMFHHTFETFALTNGYPVGVGVGGEPSLSVARDFLQPEENELHHHQQGVGISSSSSSSSITTAASTSSHHHSHPLVPQQAPGAHLPQPSHPSISVLNYHQHRSQNYDIPLHPQQQQHPSPTPNPQPQQQQQHHSSSPSMMVTEEDNDQQTQVMEALKVMSSFAQKKSLGADVQAALRTIEMTMKGSGGGGKKGVKRNTYTNM